MRESLSRLAFVVVGLSACIFNVYLWAITLSSPTGASRLAVNRWGEGWPELAFWGVGAIAGSIFLVKTYAKKEASL